MNVDIDIDVENLKEKIFGFWKNHLPIFIKKPRADGSFEYLNGYISQEPRADFFFMSDHGRHNHPEKIVFYQELMKEGCIIDYSKNIKEQE